MQLMRITLIRIQQLILLMRMIISFAINLNPLLVFIELRRISFSNLANAPHKAKEEGEGFGRWACNQARKNYEGLLNSAARQTLECRKPVLCLNGPTWGKTGKECGRDNWVFRLKVIYLIRNLARSVQWVQGMIHSIPPIFHGSRLGVQLSPVRYKSV